MSEKEYDFVGTHAHVEGAQYELLGVATAVPGRDGDVDVLLALGEGDTAVVYRNADGQMFVTTEGRWAERFDAFPKPIFQKELSNEMVDKLRLQLMTAGMSLQSIRPGILTEIANLLEQNVTNPGVLHVSAIEKRQVTAFVRLMRVAEKFMKAWVLADAAFRMIDPTKRS